jgi:hypothetical protein
MGPLLMTLVKQKAVYWGWVWAHLKERSQLCRWKKTQKNWWRNLWEMVVRMWGGNAEIWLLPDEAGGEIHFGDSTPALSDRIVAAMVFDIDIKWKHCLLRTSVGSLERAELVV